MILICLFQDSENRSTISQNVSPRSAKFRNASKLAQAGEKDPRKKATIRPIGENIRKLLEQMK